MKCTCTQLANTFRPLQRRVPLGGGSRPQRFLKALVNCLGPKVELSLLSAALFIFTLDVFFSSSPPAPLPPPPTFIFYFFISSNIQPSPTPTLHFFLLLVCLSVITAVHRTLKQSMLFIFCLSRAKYSAPRARSVDQNSFCGLKTSIKRRNQR